MPAGLYPSVIAAEERTASKAFDVTRSGAIFSARNPSYHMSLRFTRLGVTVGQTDRPASQVVRLGPATLLAHGLLMDTGSAIPVAGGRQVSYSTGDLRERYLNGPAGLEQELTLAHGPQSRVTVEAAVIGARSMRLGTGDVATILGPDSMFVRYADLYVQDARRHQLSGSPSHFPTRRRVYA